MYQGGYKGEEWWRMGDGLLLTFQQHRFISILAVLLHVLVLSLRWRKGGKYGTREGSPRGSLACEPL